MYKMVGVSRLQLRRVAFAYLMLPTLVFLLTFLKFNYAVISSACLLICFYFAARKKSGDNKVITFTTMELVLIGIAALFWCFLGGQGGFFYQTTDWNERNAIFRDLISHRWPVYYPATDTVLSYYVGHWLPAALIAKIIYVAFGSLDAAWRIGNVLLWLWTAAGVYLTFLLLIKVTRANRSGKRVAALLILIFFSGLDIIGTIINHWTLEDYLHILHLEWWADVYQFSSPTTCLFWVFNQAVPAWVATLAFLNENSEGTDVSNYGFIMITTLVCSPLPCIGLFFYMLGTIVYSLIVKVREKRIKDWFRNTFSASNVLMVLLVFPFNAALLIANAALGGTSEAADAMPAQLNKPEYVIVYTAFMIGVFFISRWMCQKQKMSKRGTRVIVLLGVLAAVAATTAVALYMRLQLSIKYPVFLMFEAGLFLILLYPFFMDDYKLYITAFLLGTASLIHVGTGYDFCMRASIPGILFLVVYCVRALTNTERKKKKLVYKVCKVLLVVLLLIGACTPAMEIFRGFYSFDQRGTSDQIGTLNQYHSSGGIYGNFVSDSYDSSLFFSRFSKFDKEARP